MSASNSSEVTPQQIGKAFVVQYYRLLHEHPESLYRFYSSSSTLMHDDPSKTVTGIEQITQRIEELALKQRQVKIRQVDCHSTVASSVVVQVCGEISSTSDNSTGLMKRFVQTFILAPADQNKQKYYIHNDIFRYEDHPMIENKTSSNTNETENSPTKQTNPQTPINIRFTSSPMVKRESAARTEVIDQEEASAKPKSYRDAIGKKEKTPTVSTEIPPTTANVPTKSKKKSKAANRTARGHPQDTTENYDDDSWYYGTGDEGYLHTGYIDDQEVFVANLSAQVTEQEIRELFRSYGTLLHIRIGNTGSQMGAANFAFIVCQSIEMAKAIVADHDNLLKNQHINVEAKKRRPFPHTFRPTYPTAASPTNYQSIGHPSAFYDRTANAPFYGNVPPTARGGGGGGRGGKRGTNNG